MFPIFIEDVTIVRVKIEICCISHKLFLKYRCYSVKSHFFLKKKKIFAFYNTGPLIAKQQSNTSLAGSDKKRRASPRLLAKKTGLARPKGLGFGKLEVIFY